MIYRMPCRCLHLNLLDFDGVLTLCLQLGFELSQVFSGLRVLRLNFDEELQVRSSLGKLALCLVGMSPPVKSFGIFGIDLLEYIGSICQGVSLIANLMPCQRPISVELSDLGHQALRRLA